MTIKKWFGTGLLLLAVGLAGASEKRTVTAENVDAKAIRLDGKLDEAVWRQAPKNANFTVLGGTNAAKEDLSFQVAASADGVFFAFDVKDSCLKASMKGRDEALWNDDCIEIFLVAEEHLPDDRNIRGGRQFVFNANAARFDAALMGGDASSRWNGDWKVAVQKNAAGFTAEVFIPYYALDLSSKATQWHFNIGRENHGAAVHDFELSTWSPSNTFLNMDHFAVLKLPAIDFGRFNVGIRALALAAIPERGSTVQVLRGSFYGGAGQRVEIKAAARRDGKIVTYNKLTVTADQSGRAVWQMPYELGSSGDYDLTLMLSDAQGRIGYREERLTLNTVPFEMKLLNPAYRNNIYAGQPDQTLKINAVFDCADAQLQSVAIKLTVRDEQDKIIAELTRPAAPLTPFEIDTRSWRRGRYQVSLQTSGNPALDGELRTAIRLVPPPAAGNTVWIDDDRQLVLNGQKFFARGFLGCADDVYDILAENGYNLIHFYMLNQRDIPEILKVLDAAHQRKLKVIMYPWHKLSVGFWGFNVRGKTVPLLPEGGLDNIRKMVEAVKTHPAFLGWYMYDEPRGAEYCAEISRVYRLLTESDPHHPVLGLDCSSDGCINKAGGDYCDLHILDLYPKPRPDDTFFRPPQQIIESVRNVNTQVGREGLWYCPQAFDGSSFAKDSSNDRPVRYRETRCIVLGAIARGATGIVPYKIGDPSCSYYQHYVNSGIFYAPDFKIGFLKGIGPELQKLEPVLLAPSQKIAYEPAHLPVLGKKYRDRNFIIVVNPESKPGRIRLHWPDKNVKQVRVLSEKRRLPVIDGLVAETLEPLAAHIYTDDPEFSDPVDIAALTAEIAAAEKTAKLKK